MTDVNDDPGQEVGRSASTCRSARVAFVAAVLDDVEPTAEAADHVAQCGECRSRLDRLSEAVLYGSPHEISCAECVRQIPAWIAAEERGGRPGRRMPRVRDHMEACPACTADLRDTADALAALTAGTLAAPPEPPRVDLSFTRRPSPLGPSDRGTGGVEGDGVVHGTAQSARTAPSTRDGNGRRRRHLLLLLLLAIGVVWTALAPGGWLHTARDARNGGWSPLGWLARSSSDGRSGDGRLDRREPNGLRSIPATRVARSTPVARGLSIQERASNSAAPPTAQARTERAPSVPTATPVASPATPRIGTAAAPLSAALGASATPTLHPTTAPPPPQRDDPEDDPDMTCTLRRPGPLAEALSSTCSPHFPRRSELDRFSVHVESRGGWTFATCGRTELDTILALYRAGGFHPGAPCSELLAIADDSCGRQSRLEVELDPGRYTLIVLEATGDAAPAPYELAVRAHPSEAECPEWIRPPDTPTATATATVQTATPTGTLTPTSIPTGTEARSTATPSATPSTSALGFGTGSANVEDASAAHDVY